jgi:hypothetical protein
VLSWSDRHAVEFLDIAMLGLVPYRANIALVGVRRWKIMWNTR